ncbi:glycosyltransferase involved in cell wall biosynthesis [Agromyces ramosus]|uniref:Glycosyltransferase involved in cell wall biosynthesis n=1 Tax=Agromyces ramosus TaxID=33879 RepID=A0A4Q7MLW3_9MICO|nr:glycosyltransferase [Agromyces ramosus]RZS68478.1 glycosyltransferase involved in cell wall biosynthesis [Agromyces ramosus]
MTERSTPVISLISAVYDVADYLPAFLSSLDAQGDLGGWVEVLLVSDGSPDASERIIEDWIASTSVDARLLRKENGGAGSARNHGLEHASGRWVSFPDPDDVLAPGYLRHLLKAADRAERDAVGIVAAKVEQFSDDPSAARDDHLLGYRYRGRRRVVDLDANPTYFHTHVPSGLYRRSVIVERDIRFDPRLRVAFDDATFAAEYALALEAPSMLVVPEATYRYRRRADGSSLVGTMWSKPAKYTEIPRHGYLRLLEARDPAPLWLQSLVMYDLEWFFVEYLDPASPNRRIDGATAAEFLDVLDRVLARIDIDLLAAFPLHRLAEDVRVALSTRKTGSLPWNDGRVRLAADGATARISCYAASVDEAVQVTVDARSITPIAERRTPIEFYGEAFCARIDLEVPLGGTVVVRCGVDRVLPLTLEPSGRSLGASISPWALEDALAADAPLSRVQHAWAMVPRPAKRMVRPALSLVRSVRAAARGGARR